MRARIGASIVLAMAVALGTTACGFFAPQTTTTHYDASDGVSGNVGQIDVRNAMLITSDGQAASLVVTLVNTGNTSQRVEIQHGGSAAKSTFVTVGPENPTEIGAGTKTSKSVVFTDINATPGSLYPVFFQYGNATGVRLLVPVLDGGLSEYSTLVPTLMPSPVPAPTATPLVAPTPSATPAQ